jgi:Glycosyl hydrolase catalytic core
MKQVVPWLEKQEFIAGYSWFDFDHQHGPGGVSSLFHGRASKKLTALGRFYASVTTGNPKGDQSIQTYDDTE